MAFQATPEQKNAIEAKGTVLVSAAAGSGKTAVLVERIVRLLTGEQPVDADRILVVTFTKAAAAEMRSRINLRLAEEVKKRPGDALLQRQMVLLQRAKICTMDSFCGDLVREHFHLLELPPDFKIVESALLAQLETKAMEQVLDRRFREEKEDFLKLLGMLGSEYGDRSLKDAVTAVYTFLRSLPFPQEWLEKTKEQYRTAGDISQTGWAEILFEEGIRVLRPVLNGLETSLSALSGKLSDGLMNLFSDAQNRANEVYRRLEQRQFDAVYQAVGKMSPIKTGRIIGLDDREKATVKRLAEAVNGAVKTLQRAFAAGEQETAEELAAMAPCVSLLLDLVWEYWQALYTMKLEKKSLDFADVEYAALSLLVKREAGRLVPAPGAQEIIDRFDEVLVDEYQDTNDLQNTIFEAVSGNASRLFMVGDVKQSIYRFRQGNPGNFIARRDAFPPYDGTADPSCVVLGSNFRSHPEICRSVNFFFRLLMTRICGEIDYTKEEELFPKAQFPVAESPAVEVHLIDRGESADGVKELEARQIAAYIKEAMAAGAIIRDENGRLRPARFGDFAILLRSVKTKAALYARELERAGIPVWTDVRGGFLDSVEIKTMLSLLQVIENPLRDVPLLAVLLSPIFGFTADEVAKMRLADPQAGLYAILVARRSEDARASAFLQTLEQMRDAAAVLPCDRLIDRLFSMTGYDSAVQAMEEGAERRANLLLLRDYARSYAGAGAQGLTGFLRYMNQLAENGRELDAAGAMDEEGDVVRISTIHHSKGLQFPVCIVAGLGAPFYTADLSGSLLLHAKKGLGLKITDPETRQRYSTLPREAISVLNKNAQISEELRVLYVAMTRAQDKLVLVCGMEGLDSRLQKLGSQLQADWALRDEPIDPALSLAAKSYADWILSCLLLHPDCEELRERAGTALHPVKADFTPLVRIVTGESLPAMERDFTANTQAEPDPALLEQIRKRLEYAYSFAALNGVFAKRTASALAEQDAKEVFSASRPAFLSAHGLTPAQRGTAVHLFMQHADYEKAAKEPKAELDRLCRAGFLSPEQGQAVELFKIEGFFASPLYARMRAAAKITREYKFMIELPAREVEPNLDERFDQETVVVQGMADCVLEEAGGLVIVDYKTDRGKSEADLVERYRPQLALYARALTQITGLPVQECCLYSFDLGTSILVGI